MQGFSIFSVQIPGKCMSAVWNEADDNKFNYQPHHQQHPKRKSWNIEMRKFHVFEASIIF